jgi:hypothetical protein
MNASDDPYLLKNGFSCELYFKYGVGVKIMDGHGRYLHNVSYVQQVEPLTLIQIPEDGLHIDLRFRVDLITAQIVLTENRLII